MRRPALIATLLALTVAGCSELSATETSPTGTREEGTPAATAKAKRHANAARSKARREAKKQKRRSTATGPAAAALAKLAVKGRAPKTGYTREEFGNGWMSTGGCNTRDRILTRDLTDKQYLDGCRVQSGTLADPYTATSIRFERGGASEVDIDHVVALSDAWQKGAQQWSFQQRVAFANDPLNLLAVDAAANRQKSDGDAATWLPPNKRFRCAFVARQVAVKRKYRAWVTRAEHDAIARVLATCPGQKLPKPGARIQVQTNGTQPPPKTASTPTTDAAPPSSGEGRAYANCTEARAHGAAPILRGSPDYDLNRKLDRDGDGIACE